MADLCAQLGDLMTLDAQGVQALYQGLADTILQDHGYVPVPVKLDDPAASKLAPDQSAAYVKADNTIYYRDPGTQDSRDASRDAIETMAHEALHAMDEQDGIPNEDLGDERSEKYTGRLYNVYGEDDVKIYGPGEVIPGTAHSEEVYVPAREIAREIAAFCKRIKNAPPESIESMKNQLADKIQDILDERWSPDDDEGGDEDGDDDDDE